MRKHKSEILIALIGLALAALFYKFPAPSERILNIQNYLITVGGIISAFVIAYLSGKIFNLRNERENRQVEINKYSEKLTNFRRLLYYVMKSRDFWVRYNDIAAFKKKYPGLNYERLHSQQGDDELSRKFWLEEEELSSSTVDLYLAMEAIYGDIEDGVMPWATDKSVSFNYSLDEIAKYYDPSNQIWYYLDGRFAKHGAGRFNDTGIWRLYESNANQAMAKIDTIYNGKEFHRLVLAEIGSEFYALYLPKLFELTEKDTGIPRSLLKTFYSLFAIMIFGVLLPIIIQSINISGDLNILLTLIFVWATSLSLLKFIFDFYEFLDEDVHVVQSSS